LGFLRDPTNKDLKPVKPLIRDLIPKVEVDHRVAKGRTLYLLPMIERYSPGMVKQSIITRRNIDGNGSPTAEDAMTTAFTNSGRYRGEVSFLHDWEASRCEVQRKSENDGMILFELHFTG
jgi:hypothetical protein